MATMATKAMISDVQEIICRLVFSGKLLRNSRTNWLTFEGNGEALTLRVDKNRAKARRVCKLWHEHFLEWMKVQTEAEVRRSWSRGIDFGLDLCNIVRTDFALFDNIQSQDSVWLRPESLVAVHFVRRECKDKKKKGLCELLVLYVLCAEYYRVRGLKKTAAKKQAKKVKKKIVSVPQEVFIDFHARSPEDTAKLAAWKLTMKNELLDWLLLQHTRMTRAL
jgi:hypothetical protein